MGLMQSQTLTGTDPLPLLSLLQTGEADGRSTPHSFSHPLVQSVLFHMHVCLYIFDMNGKGSKLTEKCSCLSVTFGMTSSTMYYFTKVMRGESFCVRGRDFLNFK